MTTYPSDWKVVPLGEVCEIQLGKMLDSENNTGDLYPYLTNKDVQWSRIDFSDIGTIRLTDDDRRKFSLSDGDLLVCEGGEVGRCAIWRGEISNCYFQKTLHRVRARSNGVVSLPFVASLFRQYASNGTLSFYTSQTSIAHLTKDKVAILPIPLPPLAEQKRIAGVLGDMDKLIENLGKRIEKKRQIKKGAMQELLTGKKRLSGFTGEWVEKRLGECGNFIGGGTPSTAVSAYWSGPIDWYTPAEIGNSKYVCCSERSITREGLLSCAAHILPVGAILLTTRASIGLRAILRREAATNQGFQSLVVNENFESEFMYYFLSVIEGEMRSRASGSTFLEISSRKLREIPIVVPSSLAEQRAIAAVLSDMDAEIANLERRQEKLKQVKKGMLQDLLTGKVRLKGQGGAT